MTRNQLMIVAIVLMSAIVTATVTIASLEALSAFIAAIVPGMDVFAVKTAAMFSFGFLVFSGFFLYFRLRRA